MLVCASLNFSPPAIARDATPEQAADGAGADAAGVVLGERDRGRQDVIGRHHLAAADVGVGPQLARVGQRALLHRVLHADAAFHDDEAVGLLDHHADQAGRRLQVVGAQVAQDLILRLHHGHGAHRLVAALEPFWCIGTAGASAALHDAAALALFGAGDALRERRARRHRIRDGQHADTERQARVGRHELSPYMQKGVVIHNDGRGRTEHVAGRRPPRLSAKRLSLARGEEGLGLQAPGSRL